MEQLDSAIPNRVCRVDVNAVQHEASAPAVCARVEQPKQSRRLTDQGADVAPFGVVAAGASQREIARLRRSTVFATDDVVHLATPERVILVDEAVLANVIGTFGDLTAKGLADVTGHERGAAVNVLSPAA